MSIFILYLQSLSIDFQPNRFRRRSRSDGDVGRQCPESHAVGQGDRPLCRGRLHKDPSGLGLHHALGAQKALVRLGRSSNVPVVYDGVERAVESIIESGAMQKCLEIGTEQEVKLSCEELNYWSRNASI